MNPADLLMYGMLAVMVVFMFRSSQKRKKQAEELRSQLVPGAKVTLHSGIIGTVLVVEDSTVVIETAGSKVEVLKGAVRSIDVWAQAPAEDAVSTDDSDLPPAPIKKTTRKPAAKKAADSAE